MFEDAFYIAVSEQERRRGYPDLALIVRPDCRQYALRDIVIEFKFLSLKTLGMTGEAVQNMDREELASLDIVCQKLNEAQAQANRYADDLAAEIRLFADNFNPQKWAVVSLGFDRIIWKKVA